MPTTPELVFTIALTVVLANFMWWTLWRHYRPNGMFGTGPRFTHDCDNCRYLGRYDLPYRQTTKTFLRKRDAWRFRRHDLYVCRTECPSLRKAGYIEYVARRSNNGPEYLSSWSDGMSDHTHPALLECHRLAKES